MNKFWAVLLTMIVVLSLALAVGCQTQSPAPGTPGTPGTQGAPGTPGTPAPAPEAPQGK